MRLSLDLGLGSVATLGGGVVPQIIFQDDFNRANENLEASSNWERVDGVAGGIKVASNVGLTFVSAGSQTAYRTAAALGIPADHYAVVDFLSTTDTTGFLLARATDSQNFVGIQLAGGTYTLYKRIAGSFTSLGTLGTASAGVRLGIEIQGQTVRAYRAGVLTVTTALGGGELTTGRPGLMARTAGVPAAFDNFEAGELPGFF